jgi:hypothetical protein
MNERKKLEEARYFYSRIQAEVDDPNAYQYNLSAFLSAARSVLQYACKEAKNKSGGQAWYDNRIANSSILPFFRDKRDINIHTEPVKPRKDYQVSMKATVHISSSLSIKLKDEKGNVIDQRCIKEAKPPHEPPTDSASVEIRYRFSDWSGSEDVTELSQKYLDELEDVVDDGVKRGFISG